MWKVDYREQSTASSDPPDHATLAEYFHFCPESHHPQRTLNINSCKPATKKLILNSPGRSGLANRHESLNSCFRLLNSLAFLRR